MFAKHPGWQNITWSGCTTKPYLQIICVLHIRVANCSRWKCCSNTCANCTISWFSSWKLLPVFLRMERLLGSLTRAQIPAHFWTGPNNGYQHRVPTTGPNNFVPTTGTNNEYQQWAPTTNNECQPNRNINKYPSIYWSINSEIQKWTINRVII